jgi:acyl carrier protein
MDINVTFSETVEFIRDFLSEEFEIDRDLIQPDSNLRETLDLDSLDYVDLVVLIEENLKIKVTGEDFKSIHSFSDFYDFVSAKQNG